MLFAYEALRTDGTAVVDRLEAGDRLAAANALRERGLVVLRLEPAAEDASAAGGGWSARRRRITHRDRILFTRQLKMLLEAGAPLVPALEAAEEQTLKPVMRQVLRRLRARVEQGDSLARALEEEAELFDPVFRSMVATGEATATLPQVFGRLAALAQQQEQARKQVLGALLYPAILSVLMLGVIVVLLLFVVPRFRALFLSLRSPLPVTTELLFAASDFATRHGVWVLGLLAAGVTAGVLALRLPATRVWLDEVQLRLPLLGPLVRRLLFARVLRVWAAMLRSHVPVLDALRQSRAAIRNAACLRALSQVEEAVTSGGRLGPALASAGLADAVIVAALRTGEENGRLAEATEFVSNWLDEDNAATIQQVTRLAEPLLLAVMGVVVGFVAMSLFVPLFDLASAAG